MLWPWVWLPILGPIRISTLFAGAVLIAVITRRRRDPMLALVALLAWAAAFEILYQVTGALVHGWPATGWIWMVAALAGWVTLAGFLGLIPNPRLLLILTIVWLLWAVTGFESNGPPPNPTMGLPKGFSIVGEVFNEVSKTLLGLAYLFGALGSSIRTPILRMRSRAALATAHAHHDAADKNHVTQ